VGFEGQLILHPAIPFMQLTLSLCGLQMLPGSAEVSKLCTSKWPSIAAASGLDVQKQVLGRLGLSAGTLIGWLFQGSEATQFSFGRQLQPTDLSFRQLLSLAVLNSCSIRWWCNQVCAAQAGQNLC